MKLKTKFNRWYNINNLWDVMAVLTQLGWREEDDDSLICDNGPHGFVQIAKWRPGEYIFEFCGGGDPTCPQRGLWRALRDQTPGDIVDHRCLDKGQLDLHQNDLLSCGEVLDLLTAIWHGQPGPRHLYWRSLASEMKELIQFNDNKHGRMTFCE